MKRLIRNFLALSRQERGIFLRALVWLPQTAVMLRLLGFRCCYDQWASPRSSATISVSGGAHALNRAKNTQRLVVAAARYGMHSGNCLSRSLTLIRLLNRHGISADLRIGAQNNSGKLQAHAWVELDDIVLNDSDDVAVRYPPFPSRPRISLNQIS